MSTTGILLSSNGAYRLAQARLSALFKVAGYWKKPKPACFRCGFEAKLELAHIDDGQSSTVQNGRDRAKDAYLHPERYMILCRLHHIQDHITKLKGEMGTEPFSRFWWGIENPSPKGMDWVALRAILRREEERRRPTKQRTTRRPLFYSTWEGGGEEGEEEEMTQKEWYLDHVYRRR